MENNEIKENPLPGWRSAERILDTDGPIEQILKIWQILPSMALIEFRRGHVHPSEMIGDRLWYTGLF